MGRCGIWQPAGLHGEGAVFFLTCLVLRGAPTGHSVPVREVRLIAGPNFNVVVCGETMTMTMTMTMPGLPRKPAAETIRLNDAGEIMGLF